jgi:hypothetical protein
MYHMHTLVGELSSETLGKAARFVMLSASVG